MQPASTQEPRNFVRETSRPYTSRMRERVQNFLQPAGGCIISLALNHRECGTMRVPCSGNIVPKRGTGTTRDAGWYAEGTVLGTLSRMQAEQEPPTYAAQQLGGRRLASVTSMEAGRPSHQPHQLLLPRPAAAPSLHPAIRKGTVPTAAAATHGSWAPWLGWQRTAWNGRLWCH